MSSISRTRVLTWNEGSLEERADELAVEEPLEIRIGGESTAVTMRTPGHDTELVAGMLLTEGLIDSSMLPLIRQEAPNTVNVALQGLRLNPKRLESIRRAQAISSSCGLCGKSSIEAIHQHFPPIHGEMTFDPSVLIRLLDTLESSQITFAQTGGVHAAAIFDVTGDLIVAREDVGRHNAVDKSIGYAVLKGLLPLEARVLVVSGRASFEIMQKALGARIPIVAAVSAPSSLAVELASASGQTLIGFLRGGRFNVYSNPERLKLPAAGYR